MRKCILVIAVVSVAGVLPACTPAADSVIEKKNVQQLLDKYLESIKTADLAVASQVWRQGPDTSAVIPFGRFNGWEAVRDGVYINFLQKAFVERNLRPDNLAITVSGDTAWAVFDWTFNAKLADGKPFSSKGSESHVYQKTEGRWVIVHLHYSAPIPGQ
jgi:ketosteroid isomerase-like protein